MKSVANGIRLDAFNISVNGFTPTGDQFPQTSEVPFSPTVTIIEEAKADIERMKKSIAVTNRRKLFLKAFKCLFVFDLLFLLLKIVGF